MQKTHYHFCAQFKTEIKSTTCRANNNIPSINKHLKKTWWKRGCGTSWVAVAVVTLSLYIYSIYARYIRDDTSISDHKSPYISIELACAYNMPRMPNGWIMINAPREGGSNRRGRSRWCSRTAEPSCRPPPLLPSSRIAPPPSLSLLYSPPAPTAPPPILSWRRSRGRGAGWQLLRRAASWSDSIYLLNWNAQ